MNAKARTNDRLATSKRQQPLSQLHSYYQGPEQKTIPNMGNQFPQSTTAKIDASQPLSYSKARQIFCVQSRRLASRSPPPLRRPPATVHAQRRLFFLHCWPESALLSLAPSFTIPN
ncbi:hypothetical protein T06_6593 [Trichinella sp. T6]|nr:hypothetical protein T06_6593 [Trichinella sp. T6]